MYKKTSREWLKHLDFILIDILVLQASFVLVTYEILKIFAYKDMMYRSLGFILCASDILSMLLMDTMANVIKRGYFKEFTITIKHSILTFSLAAVFIILLKERGDYSRHVILLTFIGYIIYGFITRTVWKKAVLKYGGFSIKKGTMLVVLDEKNAGKVMNQLIKYNGLEYVLAGIAVDGGKWENINGVPIKCSIKDAAAYISREWIDSVYIACSMKDPQIQELMDNCHEMAIPIYYKIPDMTSLGPCQDIEKIGNTRVIAAYITDASAISLMIKRLMDIAGGIIGSLFAVLIIIIIGPLIKKESPGPVIFTQTRIGKNGKKFKMYKIRSMCMDAEEKKKDLWKESRGEMFKLDFDPRIIGNKILPDGTKKTGIGEFIRKTSLDEFPQFFNVLKGQMSLVGTRPPTLDEWEKYKFHHRARMSCKPGITGMWQANGRSSITDFEEVVKLDTEYVTNWSLSLDIKILLKTVVALLTKKGAM